MENWIIAGVKCWRVRLTFCLQLMPRHPYTCSWSCDYIKGEAWFHKLLAQLRNPLSSPTLRFLTKSLFFTSLQSSYFTKRLNTYTSFHHDAILKRSIWAGLHVKLVERFPAFHGTRRGITVVTRAHNWPLSRATRIQSTPTQHVSLRSILILFSQSI
jgi:hypothetical protein